MELLADRFCVIGERVLDLATGAEVTFIASSAGGESEQRRWAERCDRLATLHHPDVARLLDFGRLGESRRFEAWRATSARCPGRIDPDRVRAHADRFFAAAGLTPTALVRSGGSLGVVRDQPEGGPGTLRLRARMQGAPMGKQAVRKTGHQVFQQLHDCERFLVLKREGAIAETPKFPQ